MATKKSASRKQVRRKMKGASGDQSATDMTTTRDIEGGGPQVTGTHKPAPVSDYPKKRPAAAGKSGAKAKSTAKKSAAKKQAARKK